ncbi:hypothetical protein BLA29_001694 [Euroglyphus maynei]|uniref:Uncharacterized protein n=1 Tax=Euroglyphus maynei TaxID=6958 RepID=A0A1Y3ANX1_EURMA|nr:hypothetical protein BLA29_001694 [Euroglyphus maynei]
MQFPTDMVDYPDENIVKVLHCSSRMTKYLEKLQFQETERDNLTFKLVLVHISEIKIIEKKDVKDINQPD